MHHLDTTKGKSEKDGWGTATHSCYNSAMYLEHRTKLIKPSHTWTVWSLSHCPARALLYLCLLQSDYKTVVPLSTGADFTINTGTGSRYEIGRQGLIMLGFFNPPLIASTLCDAYKTAPSKFAVFPTGSPNSSHGRFLERVNSTWFCVVLSIWMFSSTTCFPFPVFPCSWFGWYPDIDLMRCKAGNGEQRSIWMQGWVDSIPGAVRTLVILFSP